MKLRYVPRAHAACAFALATILPLLGACAGDKPKTSCPRFGILADAAKMTQFRDGPGRDVVDVIYTAEVPRVALTCSGDEKSVKVALKLQVVASPGPALGTDNKVSVPFFVALTRDDREVVTREIYSSDFEFAPGERTKGATEEAEIDIPLPEGARVGAYEVLVGLKLDRAQLEFNRSRKPG